MVHETFKGVKYEFGNACTLPLMCLGSVKGKVLEKMDASKVGSPDSLNKYLLCTVPITHSLHHQYRCPVQPGLA